MENKTPRKFARGTTMTQRDLFNWIVDTMRSMAYTKGTPILELPLLMNIPSVSRKGLRRMRQGTVADAEMTTAAKMRSCRISISFVSHSVRTIRIGGVILATVAALEDGEIGLVHIVVDVEVLVLTT